MRILVTNDDGIDSPGLHALAQALIPLGDVTIFAPTSNVSGASASIGDLGHGLPDVFDARRSELEGVRAAYHFDGPPALAALLGCLGIFGQPPDIVLAGVNPGLNVGYAALFSGTIGACIAADALGVPGIAISQKYAIENEEQQWHTAAEVAASLVQDVADSPRLLNVNVPNVSPQDLRGRRETFLAVRLPFSVGSPTLTPMGDGRYGAALERFLPFDSPPGSDTSALDDGYVSVTRLRPTCTAT